MKRDIKSKKKKVTREMSTQRIDSIHVCGKVKFKLIYGLVLLVVK